MLTLYYTSVLPRLRFGAIVTKKFENDAAKTVCVAHLARIDFWPVAGAVWKITMPKITLFFTEIPIVVTAVLIGVQYVLIPPLRANSFHQQ